MWYLTFHTRDQTHCPAWQGGFLTTGLPGKFQEKMIYKRRQETCVGSVKMFLTCGVFIFLFVLPDPSFWLLPASTWSDGGSVRPSYWLVLHNLTPQVIMLSWDFSGWDLIVLRERHLKRCGGLADRRVRLLPSESPKPRPKAYFWAGAGRGGCWPLSFMPASMVMLTRVVCK